jgi:predicted AlkP superfamily pyrophosphatase or phosphodiesterase
MKTTPRFSKSFPLAAVLAMLVALAAIFFVASAAQNAPQAPLLVLISVDGMRPDYVTAADAHGAKIPNLRRFMKEGTYAEGVEGVIPTSSADGKNLIP